MQTVRLTLVGLGNLGRRFCQILQDKRDLLQRRYSLDLALVGAADSLGAAYDTVSELDPGQVVAIKASGGSIADYPNCGRKDWLAPDLVATAQADVLLEASPVNLEQGAEPGISCIRIALRRGMHVVTANKGPLVLAYGELHDLAAAHGLPALPLGQRDLRGAVIQQLEAVPNLCTGYVIDMLADGMTWDEARAQAREEGVLEGDGSWDLEGWDAAAKLVILANAVLRRPTRIDEVSRTGIIGLEAEGLQAARERGERYRLLARAQRDAGGDYRLSVAPASLSPDHPLGRLGRKQMGVVYETDIYGTITAIIDDEPSPMPSAAAMLRDLLDIFA
jgi:homoserine dehydrogenase